MRCASCGAENAESAKFCSSCGKSLVVVPSSSFTGFRTCVSCGRAIDWNATFCQFCGKDYRAQAGLAQKAPKKSGYPLAGGILTIIGGVVSFIVFLAVVWVSTDPSSNGLSDFGWITLVLTFVCAMFAFVGGAASILRKYYLVALLGAICSLAGLVVFGIPAVILVAISHKEFS